MTREQAEALWNAQFAATYGENFESEINPAWVAALKVAYPGAKPTYASPSPGGRIGFLRAWADALEKP